MINVGWLAPSADCWDTNMLRRLLDGDLYPHGLKVRHHAGFPAAVDGAFIVCPGRYFHQHTDQISEAIAVYDWVILARTSDEEDLFDVGKIDHPNVRFWVQTPRRQYPADVRVFGVGFPAHLNNLPVDPPVKDTDVFLSAQRSNGLPGDRYRVYERRAAVFDSLEGRGVLVERDGFAQGDRAEYVRGMLSAKVAPAPTGMVSCDSFRFHEALEAHCVPIGDAVSAADGPTNYWQRLYGDVPFPTFTDVEELPAIIDTVLADWPATANRVAVWYLRLKRQMAHDLVADLRDLGACA